ncbi:MAG: hypothetical protein E7103_05700 [Prevotella sp.]|jgi:hypothetical protein|nr:hypothetical protein [Prevotella sp.]
MRKYLMTGMAALAISAAFTSCSKDTDVYNSDQPKQDIQATYEQNFIKVFGQPAANQDWGFGSGAGTRTWNVNGNQWHDGVNYNYEYDAKVTTDEMNKVFNYVNDKNNVETVDQISFTEYWVTQIWNGEDDANATGAKAPASISYPNQNGATTTIIGGAQMDKLEIKETQSADSWIHCNNFNGADNNDWKEGGEGGRTLMTSSGTYSFRYTNSQSSYLSEKYIIVPGAKIDESLAGFYYVCFDFERGYDAKELAEEESYGTCEIWKSQATDTNPDAGYWQQNENWTLKGFYTASSADLQEKLEELKGTKVQNITFKGYKTGDKHCDGDDNYTDWIVRISPAKVKSNYDIRIIGEDLSAGEDGNDFDFNDIVFDVKFTGDNTAKICIVAAGGTLPLRVAGQEVHGLFHQDTNIMINTNAADAGYPNQAYEQRDNLPTFDITLTGVKAANGKNIKIEVEKEVNGVKQWVELKANDGEPAAKIGVKPGFDYCNERQGISSKYPRFTQWVQNVDVVWYEKDAE